MTFTCEPCLLKIGKKCMGCQTVKSDLTKCQKCSNKFCQLCQQGNKFICGHHSCANCHQEILEGPGVLKCIRCPKAYHYLSNYDDILLNEEGGDKCHIDL